MKLEEAKEILKAPGIPWGGEDLKKHYKARQLGIEAMNAIEKYRKMPFYKFLKQLPSETKDLPHQGIPLQGVVARIEQGEQK